MNELFAEFWWVFLIALLVGIIVARWIFAANRKASITRTEPVEGEDGGAKRNQVLIDAAPAASVPPPTPQGMGGIEAVVAHDAAHAPPAHEAGAGDDLTRIKGVGPKLAAMLRELGITQFSQIAAWDEEDIDQIDAQLIEFSGRIRRDSWVEQARMLASGDTKGFEERFGAL
jgi:predicted flap endonuclease-1-like 5' DNA nuclease